MSNDRARIEIRPRADAHAALMRRGAWDGPRAWRIVAHTTQADAPRTLAELQAARPAALWEYRTTDTQKNPPAHLHIPAAVAQLGIVLDLTTQTDATRTTWDAEVSGMLMCTDADAMSRRAGSAALYLLRTERAEAKANDREPNAAQRSSTHAYTLSLANLKTPATLLTIAERVHRDDPTIDIDDVIAALRDLETQGLVQRDGPTYRRSTDVESRPSRHRHRNHHDGDTADAGTTYAAWHRREPSHVDTLDGLPDVIGVYIGRATRIGYRSDKWKPKGHAQDYDHDYTEPGYTAPEVWADRADLDHAHAIVIVGGNQRITPEGID